MSSDASHTYRAHCHCKAVDLSFTVGAPLSASPAVHCNCSICDERGYVLTFVPKAAVSYAPGAEDKLTTYLFGKKSLAHKFCSVCGSSVVCQQLEGDTMAVNLRCVEGVDWTKLEKTEYDGKSL